jgi:hypothetical protein
MHTYMLIKYTFLIIFSFFIASCGNESSFIEHEQKVYKALLSHMGGDDAKLLVIKEESVQEHRLSADEFLKEKNEIEAYREYVALNMESSKLPIDYNWNRNVKLITKEELDNIFNKTKLKYSWKEFYRKYPDATGIIGLSRVGFNKSFTEAFLYIEVGCGALCGNGYVAVIKRGLFGWDVEFLEHLWVS